MTKSTHKATIPGHNLHKNAPFSYLGLPATVTRVKGDTVWFTVAVPEPAPAPAPVKLSWFQAIVEGLMNRFRPKPAPQPEAQEEAPAAPVRKPRAPRKPKAQPEAQPEPAQVTDGSPCPCEPEVISFTQPEPQGEPQGEVVI